MDFYMSPDNAPEASVFSADQINFDELAQTQKQGFDDVATMKAAEEPRTSLYYQWKYCNPFGFARVAQIKESNQVVSSSTMFPLRIIYKGMQFPAWQTGDVMSLPSARGKGYYSACLKALGKEITQNEIFFSFPNKSSIRGFVIEDWSNRGTITAWAGLPSLISRTSHPHFSNFSKISEFGKAQDDFNTILSFKHGPMLDKSSVYMNWRYAKNPNYQYHCYSYTLNGNLAGVIILRKAHLSGFNSALIMDLLCTETSTELKLLRFASALAREQRCKPLFTLNNRLSPAALIAGFCPVPAFILPKRQVLMARAIGPETMNIVNLPWHVQMGDWDGF
jgi:hypothetical protein